MKFRVSFYRKAEVIKGRAPRIFEDVEADNQLQALQTLFPNGYLNWKDRTKAKPEDVVIRSVYKAPDKPIPDKPSYVFETGTARDRWYRTHKSETMQKVRHCKEGCGREVHRYQRVCDLCKEKHKFCGDCGKEIDTRRRFCDDCLANHETKQESERRKKRRDKLVLARLERQLKTAKKMLNNVSRESCVNAAKYQGLRFPHVNGASCRACLEKFIEVQTIYYENVKAGRVEMPTPTPVTEAMGVSL